MKSAFIVLLIVAVIVLGFSVYSLQKEFLGAKENAALSEKRNEDLQRELMRTKRLYAEKERFLSEIEESIEELDSKVDLEALERHIPKKEWSEIKPVIDKLRDFKQEIENDEIN